MTFYIDTTDQTGGHLIASATDTTRVSLQSLVRNDTSLPITVRPLTITAEDTTTADFLTTDSFEIIVGEHELAPNGGTFKVLYGSGTTTALDFNITESQLEAKLSTLFRSQGKSAVTVRKLSDGAWRIIANDDGALVTGSVTVDADALAPTSSWDIMEADLGSATAPFDLVLVLRQIPLAYSQPTTLETGVGRSGTLTLNTVEMFEYSQRLAVDSFEVPFSVRRTRLSGEVKTIFRSPLTILKSALDPLSSVPVGVGTPLSLEAALILFGGGGSSSCGNSLFVDVDGSNTTGTRERFDKPFLDVSNAVAAASSGDTVFVRPGTYAITSNLAKNGVSIDLAAGANLVQSSGSNHMFSDGGISVAFNLTGEGSVTYTGTGKVFLISHASSIFRVKLRGHLTYTNTGAGATDNALIYHTAGEWWGDFDELECTGTGVNAETGIYWENGPHHTTCRKLKTNGYSIWSNATGTILGDLTGNLWFNAQELQGSGTTLPAITMQGNPFARVWVNVEQVECLINNDGQAGSGDAIGLESGFLYVTANKVLGSIFVFGSAAHLYVTAQKMAIKNNNCAINLLDGESFIDIDHFDDANMQTIATTPDRSAIIDVSGGSHIVRLGECIKAVNYGNGVALSGGALNLRASHISTAVSAATYNPATVSAAGLTLSEGTRLIANGSRDSVESTGGALTVKAYGVFAKQAPDSNITINPVGGMTVDSSVA